ncbi:MAG: hypothetical protein ACR2P1_12185 [Pseudomonadales bacterium]
MKPRSLWKSVRQLIVFQIKLTADALRDLLLSPISMGAVLLDFVLRLDEENSLFNRLMHYGVLSDEYINLFGQYHSHTDSGNLDSLVNKAEKTLKEEYLAKNTDAARQDK